MLCGKNAKKNINISLKMTPCKEFSVRRERVVEFECQCHMLHIEHTERIDAFIWLHVVDEKSKNNAMLNSLFDSFTVHSFNCFAHRHKSF